MPLSDESKRARFAENLPTEGEAADTAKPTRPSIENRREIPSYFHAHGNCQKGDRCDFAYGTAAAAPASGATTLSMEEQAGAQHSDSESDIDHEDDIDSDM